jgi:outer membrane protein TolC
MKSMMRAMPESLLPLWCAAALMLSTSVAGAQGTLVLTLHDAAAMAVEGNPVIAAAHRDAEAADLALSKAWREYFPTVTANARYSHLNDDIDLSVPPIPIPLPPRPVTLTIAPITLLDRSTLRADLSATMPIFTGLRIEAGIRAQRHLVADATAQDTLALHKGIAEALVAYHQCLLARQVVQARTEARATIVQHAHDVELLRAQGIATQYDAIRARLAVAEADRALDEALNQSILADRVLRKAIAVDDDREIVLADTLAFLERNVELEPALAEGHAARPELASIREKREAVRAAAWSEKGKMLPQIGAFAKYELVDRGLTQLDPKWVVGVGASLTIFNGLKDLAAGQAYDIQERKLDDIEQEVSRAVTLEIRKYLYDMRTAARAVTSSRTSVELSTEALRMANRRFETGAGTSLEVLDAQTSMVASRTACAAALTTYRTSYIQLVRALGRTGELMTGVF